MHRTTVAILFGGCSEEHEVSVKSAMEIASSIDLERYEPVYVGITRTGSWRICERPGPGWQEGPCLPSVLSPDPEAHGLVVAESGGQRVVRVDVVFPVLHGRSGEDGSVQGLLQLSGIPYVGCDVQSSAICMDKSLTYVVAASAGIATPEFTVVTGSGSVDAHDLRYPLFVKPARSGSSFGVSRVERYDELDAALTSARRYDSKVVIERAVIGTEVGCAVLGRGSDLVVGEVDQIDLRHGIFRIHQEDEPQKGSENSVVTVPAPLADDERRLVQETARSVYAALGCDGLARVDMFRLPDGGLVLNEVNTLPGFTTYSRYPRMMAAAGIGLPDLIGRLIDLALAR